MAAQVFESLDSFELGKIVQLRRVLSALLVALRLADSRVKRYGRRAAAAADALRGAVFRPSHARDPLSPSPPRISYGALAKVVNIVYATDTEFDEVRRPPFFFSL